MNSYSRIASAVILSLAVNVVHAQHDLPGGGWTYDPAKDGMKDLRVLKPIEGCNVPGGLKPITDSDEPGVSVKFWCGPPPFCLTEDAISAGEQCTILRFSRREPRYDPNGRPGANGVRDPEDLRCVNTGLMPIDGRCPLPPELNVSINPTVVRVNEYTTLTINSPHATQLRMSCSGANAVFDPYHLTNLDEFAGSTQSFGASLAMTAGTTTCDVTASNARGSITRSASFSVSTPPPPPPPPPSGGGACEGVNYVVRDDGGGIVSVVWNASQCGGTGGDGNGDVVVPVDDPTYHFRVCLREAANGGNGGGCYAIYWTPNEPYGNCSGVAASSAPGYGAVRAEAYSQSIMNIITAERCTH